MKCPKCKNDKRFYVIVQISGSTEEYYDGDREYLTDESNAGFYDGLKEKHCKWFYCDFCKSRVERW